MDGMANFHGFCGVWSILGIIFLQMVFDSRFFENWPLTVIGMRAIVKNQTVIGKESVIVTGAIVFQTISHIFMAQLFYKFTSPFCFYHCDFI